MAEIGTTTIHPDAAGVGTEISMCRFQAPASGSIAEIFMYVATLYSAGTIRLAIYNDDYTLRAESSEINVTSGNDWKSGTITTTVVSGTYYHLAFHRGTIDFDSRRVAGVADQLTVDSSSSAYPTWDDPLGAHVNFAFEYSIYAPIVASGPSVILLGDGLT